jgi:hypothetical protein
MNKRVFLASLLSLVITLYGIYDKDNYVVQLNHEGVDLPLKDIYHVFMNGYCSIEEDSYHCVSTPDGLKNIYEGLMITTPVVHWEASHWKLKLSIGLICIQGLLSLIPSKFRYVSILSQLIGLGIMWLQLRIMVELGMVGREIQAWLLQYGVHVDSGTLWPYTLTGALQLLLAMHGFTKMYYARNFIH